MKDALVRYIEEELLSHRMPGGISEDDDLIGSGLLDSLGIMQVVWYLEERLEVSIPPEDVTIENFQSIGKIHSYLERKRPGG